MLHFSTKNKSFINMYDKLQGEGIKYSEFLELHDPDLEFIDPHAPNLDLNYIIKIVIECKVNPWYFFREVVRFPISGGTDIYDIHLGNLAITWAMLNNISLLVMLPRQHGKTMSVLAVYLYFILFGTTNSNILFFNKEFSDSKLNVNRVKDLYKYLPEFLKKSPHKKDKSNLTAFGFGDNNNFIKAISPPTSPEKAAKKGRGETSPLMYLDEFAFISFIQELYNSASPAFSKASENAEKQGMPFSRVISTTPAYLDHPSGAFCYQIIKGSYKFRLDLLDMDINVVRDLIAGDYSGSNMMYIEYSYTELGRDEIWFKKQCAGLMHDMTAIKMELLLEWLNASQSGVFSEEQIDLLKTKIKKPIDNIMVRNHNFVLYKPYGLLRNKNFMISVDPSTGAGRDFTAFTFIDPISREILGSYKTNKTDLKLLQDLCIDLLNMYFPNAFLLVESNSIGRGILDNLMYTNIENKLYFEYKRQVATKKIQGKSVAIHSKASGTKTKVYGAYTDETRRNNMMSIMFDAVENEPELFIDREIFDEMKTLERDKTGKINHRQGMHDDCLMSYLMGLEKLAYGEKISQFIRYREDKEGNVIRKELTTSEQFNQQSAPINFKKSSLLDNLLSEYGGQDKATFLRNLK